MDSVVLTLHALLAGVWLGGVVFTTTVVTPALRAMKWRDSERVRVRSVIGRQYAPIGVANLLLLLVTNTLVGITTGFARGVWLEYGLVLFVMLLTASHGAYFGPRLEQLAALSEESSVGDGAVNYAAEREGLQRLSFVVSLFNLAASVAVVVLAVNA